MLTGHTSLKHILQAIESRSFAKSFKQIFLGSPMQFFINAHLTLERHGNLKLTRSSTRNKISSTFNPGQQQYLDFTRLQSRKGFVAYWRISFNLMERCEWSERDLTWDKWDCVFLPWHYSDITLHRGGDNALEDCYVPSHGFLILNTDCIGLS